MDPSMIVGIVSGFGLIVYGIGFGNIQHFLEIQSFVIVVGGTFAALIASFPLKVLKKVPKQFLVALKGQLPNASHYIDQIVECAQLARKNGLLALEEHANAQEDLFMKESLLLIVDAVDADKVRSMLEADLVYLDERHNEACSFFDRGAGYAPAFGMIGTLIGLILMLANLQLDSADGTATLTSGMAIALITTFYGSCLANLFFTPVSSKLKARHDREMLCKQIIIEGILSIQAGENPKFIREKLVSFLPQKERTIEDGGEKAKKEKKEKKPKKAKEG